MNPNETILAELRLLVENRPFFIKTVAQHLPSLSGLSAREARKELKRALTELNIEHQGKRWKL